MGKDFWPDGVAENYKALSTMARYSYEQGLAIRLLTVEEMFAEGNVRETIDGARLTGRLCLPNMSRKIYRPAQSLNRRSGPRPHAKRADTPIDASMVEREASSVEELNAGRQGSQRPYRNLANLHRRRPSKPLHRRAAGCLFRFRARKCALAARRLSGDLAMEQAQPK